MNLSINNLTVKNQNSVLIKNLNLHLELGNRLIVYGSNGCGKSTLIKLMFHSIQKKQNSIEWGFTFNDVQYVPQENPFHSATPDYVIDFLVKSQNLNFPFAKSHLASEKSFEILKKVELANKPLSQLSGGERQKLKIAQALLLNAKVLLLDEPFNGVDQKSQTQIYSLLNRIQNQTLQILVLHNLLDIMKMNSPVLWI